MASGPLPKLPAPYTKHHPKAHKPTTRSDDPMHSIGGGGACSVRGFLLEKKWVPLAEDQIAMLMGMGGQGDCGLAL